MNELAVKSTTTNLSSHNALWPTVVLVLCSAWLFTAPTNLFWKILPDFGFVGGLQIDYLIPKLYINDVLALLLGIGSVVGLFLQKRSTRTVVLSSLAQLLIPLFVLSGLLFLRQLWTPFPIAGIWFLSSGLVRIVALIFFYKYIQIEFPHNRRVIPAMICWTVLSVALFQSLIGLTQFFRQTEMSGYLLFGEPEISRAIGLYKTDWQWLDQLAGTNWGYRIAPYGTTPHPNILAGFLSSSLLIFWNWFLEKKPLSLQKKFFIGVSSLPILFTLFLTQSITAWASLGIGLIILAVFHKTYLLKQAISTVQFFSILGLIIAGSLIATYLVVHLGASRSESINRRQYLNESASEMTQANPLFGVGLNQFTAQLEDTQASSETVRFVQPAHQVFLLFVAENGLLGVLGVFFLLRSPLFKTRSVKVTLLLTLLILLPLISFDHYPYSLIHGQNLLLISMFFIFGFI